MAGAHRGKTPPLIQLLRREPYRFDSSQVARILEARQRKLRTADVTFRSSLSLTFPVSDIESVVLPDERTQSPVVTVNFLGLGGAMGPFPTPYTEYLNNAVRRRETAGRDFLDLFNHRFVSAAIDLAKLFRPVLQAPHPHDSQHAKYLYALLGLRTPGIAETIPKLAPTLLPLAALLNERPFSAHAIERCLCSYFGVPARMIPFRGDWMHIPLDQRSAIGATGRHHRLGQTAMLGGRQWDQSAGITIEIGPLAIDKAEQFLPANHVPESLHGRLVELLDFLVGGDVTICVRLLVATATVSPSRLSSRGPMRLGWTSWLHCAAPGKPLRHSPLAPPRLGRTARLGGAGSIDGDGAEPARRLGGARLAPVCTIVLHPALNTPKSTAQP